MSALLLVNLIAADGAAFAWVPSLVSKGTPWVDRPCSIVPWTPRQACAAAAAS